MRLEESLARRSDHSCELCKSSQDLSVYEVPPKSDRREEDTLLCPKCNCPADKKKSWTAVTEQSFTQTCGAKSRGAGGELAVTEPVAPMKSWASDNLDMMYLDENLAWPKTNRRSWKWRGGMHRDCNGNILQTGDSVSLIKSIDVRQHPQYKNRRTGDCKYSTGGRQ